MGGGGGEGEGRGGVVGECVRGGGAAFAGTVGLCGRKGAGEEGWAREPAQKQKGKRLCGVLAALNAQLLTEGER
jgi:hypothetical protein